MSVRPKIVISKCIEYNACRYNGELIPNEFVRRLANFVDFVPVCPEVEIGLGIPRDPVRIISKDSKLKLILPSTNKDLTATINNFSLSYLKTIKSVDGFILKSRSPSCGVGDAKIYSDASSNRSMGKTNGFFANEVIKKFAGLAIEHEGRLSNFRIRENFLTKVFTFASFREISSSANISDLIQFHTKNKYLLMSYNQFQLKNMGRLIANNRDVEINILYQQYLELLKKLFKRLPRIGSNINVLLHTFGYFSDRLTGKEKSYFNSLLESYRNLKLPLSAIKSVVKSWIIKYEVGYLENQTYFNPFPEELIDIKDSGIGREL